MAQLKLISIYVLFLWSEINTDKLNQSQTNDFKPIINLEDESYSYYDYDNSNNSHSDSSSDETNQFIDLMTEINKNIDDNISASLLNIFNQNVSSDFNENTEVIQEIFNKNLTKHSINQKIILQMRKIFQFEWSVEDLNHRLPENFEPSQFISDFYKTVSNPGGNEIILNNFNKLSKIWSFPEKNSSILGLFQFDIRELENETILDAELHVYRLKLNTPANYFNSPYYLLKVYQVVYSEDPQLMNPDMHQLLNVHYVSAHGTGRQVFKVKSTINMWQKNKSSNFGLIIIATTVQNVPVTVNFARNGLQGYKYQPTLIVFTDNQHKLDQTKNDDDMNKFLSVEQFNQCIKQSMMINFEKLGFGNAILSPKVFEAYQCSRGGCNFPLQINQNVNNHAILQNIVNYIDQTINNNAKCVPAHLKPIPILYVNRNNVVILQKLDNIIVDSCKCQ